MGEGYAVFVPSFCHDIVLCALGALALHLIALL